MATPRPVLLPARSRRTPSAIYFEEDALAHSALTQCGRIRYASFESAEPARLEGDIVFVVGEEHLLVKHLKQLRAPNVRVLALSSRRFRDARIDGTVYAYLPEHALPTLLERMFDNAADHMHLVLTRREASDKLAEVNTEIHALNQIGAALSAEHEPRELLNLILTKCRELTRADAGSIYLVTESGVEESEIRQEPPAGAPPRRAKFLRFMLAQNDSVHVPLGEVVLPVDESSIAGYVAQHGSVVMIEDAYAMESWVPYAINKRFDQEFGYRTKSILAVAMKNPKDEIVGVVQLINAKRNWRAVLSTPQEVENEVMPFSTRQMETVSSLASQAAVAYENSQHYENIQRLFEGFVKASIAAIEQRDPTASGHSFRVTNLTLALAEEVDRDQGYFRDVHFSRQQMKEIRYASLLHDFGKVGVREQVLTKARKLYSSQLEVIACRFTVARRAAQSENTERRLRCLLEEGREAYESKLAQFDAELQEQLAELDRYAAIVEASSLPTVQPEGTFEVLKEIAGRTYRGCDGAPCPLLTPEEVRLLSMRKGSLDDSERAEVESHVLHSYNFLKQIPWTGELRNVPEIARHHHEKLNGNGYPGNLFSEQIPLASRMMTIADIFDALAASDRPYKSSVSVDKALQILAKMAGDGEIDAQLFALFVRAKVYELWKVECFEY
jgi:HD-GYP domain-containing protein (c-di-GMP phosphodiesterase class II)